MFGYAQAEKNLGEARQRLERLLTPAQREVFAEVEELQVKLDEEKFRHYKSLWEHYDPEREPPEGEDEREYLMILANAMLSTECNFFASVEDCQLPRENLYQLLHVFFYQRFLMMQYFRVKEYLMLSLYDDE